MRCFQEICNIQQNQSQTKQTTWQPTIYYYIKMFNDLTQNVINLIDTIKPNRRQNPVNPNSFLSLPCGHLISIVRSGYQMPTLLQYCEQLNDVVNESLKCPIWCEILHTRTPSITGFSCMVLMCMQHLAQISHESTPDYQLVTLH